MFLPKPGLLVGNRYVLERAIGRGGMGEVWRAHDRELDTPCAVKFILQHLVMDQGIRDRFAREAKAVARLRSPHVVQILGVGEVEDVPYLAMELLSGETLLARLDRLGKLDPVVTMKVIEQAADALESAHQAGIVHRDLKPENIWFWSGNKVFVKVLDFGVAKTSLKTGSLQTATGALVGTPQYMSPEQALGNRDVDHRSDLWSLAVITVECLCGKRPFDSEGLGDLLLQIVSNTPPSLQELAPELPQSLHEWWARALAREPRDRFQSASELVDALRPHLIGNGPFSSPYSGNPYSAGPYGAGPYGANHASTPPHSGNPFSSDFPHSGGAAHSGRARDDAPRLVVTDAGGLIDSRPEFPTEVQARPAEPQPAEPRAAEPHSGQPHSGHVHSAQPHAPPPHSTQKYSGLPHAGHQHAAQQHAAQAHGKNAQPHSAQSPSGQPNSWLPLSAQPVSVPANSQQPHSHQPRSAQAVSAQQPYPQQPYPQQPYSQQPPSQQPNSRQASPQPNTEAAVVSGRSQRPSPGSVGPISSSRRPAARDGRQRNVVIAAALVTVGVLGTAWRMLSPGDGSRTMAPLPPVAHLETAPPATGPEVPPAAVPSGERTSPERPSTSPPQPTAADLPGAPSKSSPWDAVLGNPKTEGPRTTVEALKPRATPPSSVPTAPPSALEPATVGAEKAAPPPAVPPRAVPARATAPRATPPRPTPPQPTPPRATRPPAPAPTSQPKSGISAADVGLSAPPSKVNPPQSGAKPGQGGPANDPSTAESEAERKAKLKRRIGLGSK